MKSFFRGHKLVASFLLHPATFLIPLALLPHYAHAAPGDYFRISVVDADTGRGVPLVELTTTHQVRYVSDSNGVVAVGDPELFGQKIYFSIKSHGYEVPKDGFGNRGLALDVKAGGQGQIKIKRINIAQRLYRITGAGIYRDSILTGVPVPLKQPLLNGLVMGQDTVEATLYKGKIFWLWGDTNRAAYPLGNFKTSSATSLLPGQGGLDPDKGVDLTYFVNPEGFSKEMIPLQSNSPIWMGGLFTLSDSKGEERLFGSYAKAESDSKMSERGLAVFNDDKAQFERVGVFNSILQPGGDPFRATSNEANYLYFNPFERTLADYAHVVDGRKYQAFTPLVAGTRFDGANTKLERDARGNLLYGWKTDTPTVSEDEVKTLVEKGVMKAEEAPSFLRDIDTDAPVAQHGSSTYWNPYRKRWVKIFSQKFGTSYLGELWFAEADTPTGPWVYARKILTHDKFTFSNPTQHPFFAQNGGRQIYFEGTYTSTYSGSDDRTPRYDYNQIMYRLDLSDERLDLPVPVYRLKDGSYALREQLEAGAKWPQVVDVAFFALPPTAKREGLVAVYALGDGLTTQGQTGTTPLFYALATNSDNKSPGVVPLYDFVQKNRNPQPLGRVWRNPSRVLSLDWNTKAVAE